MDKKKFKELLEKDESRTLDFKSELYHFTPKAGKEQKRQEDSKFIKDIISFSNTTRTDSAYIIFGVECKPNGSKNLVGIENMFDEAELQRKVKDKVSPVPRFLFYGFEFEERQFAIIEFPLPIHALPCKPTKNLPGLDEGRIYVRLGSTNEAATSDEEKELFRWLEALQDQRKSMDDSRMGLKKKIRNIVNSRSNTYRAIIPYGEELGISKFEVDILIEEEKSRKEKKFLSLILLFILGAAGVMAMSVIYGIGGTDNSGRMNFEEKFNSYVLADQIDSAQLLLSQFRFRNQYQPNTSLVVRHHSYNDEVKWYNNKVESIIEVYLERGDKSKAFLIDRLFSKPIAIKQNDNRWILEKKPYHRLIEPSFDEERE